MKAYRPLELKKEKEDEKAKRYSPLDKKSYTPTNHHFQNKLIEYETLAMKAKQQLKEFQGKKTVSPETKKYQPLAEEKNMENKRHLIDTTEEKNNINLKTLQHSHSQKMFKKQQNNDELKHTQQYQKGKTTFQPPLKQENRSLEPKMDSPRKRFYVDNNQYKMLHEKLDLIEHKITDMKKNLQKKKEEKQKNMQNKQRLEKQNEIDKKTGLKDLINQMPQHTELHTFHFNPYSPRHNIYYVSEIIRAYKDEQSLAKLHLKESTIILQRLEKSKRSSQEDMKRIMLDLPIRKGYEDKKTVIFDLDQTLIHCNQNLNPPYDVKLPIKFPTGQVIEAGINIRPYAKQILKNLSRYFQIILFTASHSCYANEVIDHLDPNREWIHHRLFREHCFLSPEGMYIKDLRIINRNLKDMVLVDNAAYSYAYQLQNGIPIFPYYHGQIDFQLKMLEDYLMKLLFCKDVREINNNTFRLSQYKQYYSRLQKLVEQLYINK